MNRIKRSVIIVAVFALALVLLFSLKTKSDLPLVAIANYGRHSSLEAALLGLKKELESQGFIENKTVCYTISDVSFEASLIPQMISKIKNQAPKVIVVMTTPVAQFAKGAIKETPLIYNVITDPVEAGLLKEADKPDGNMTGSSDQQDLRILLQFAKKLLPQGKRVGLLYAVTESNDLALVRMMQQAAAAEKMEVVAIPIDQAGDIPLRMQGFKGKVDFIYVGSSGPIQPTLPVIAIEASKMNLPILNLDEGAVLEGLVMASFGVDYVQVGINAGKLVSRVLKGEPVDQITPIYPRALDHHGFISQKNARKYSITVPENLQNTRVVD